ncbi:MAG: hypothetical protein MUO94_03965, partial [Thermoplasmata archaeon]|nr:hypothetical protein [Thermoplasmata archaeon]
MNGSFSAELDSEPMKFEEYREIYSRLKTPKDMDRAFEELGIDRELLLVIYTQRTVRDATRRFYVVKNDIKDYAKTWRRGESINRLAKRINFPAVLFGLLLAAEIDLPRKLFWKYLRDP